MGRLTFPCCGKKRGHSTEHVIHTRAESPHVNLVAVALALQELWCNVAQ